MLEVFADIKLDDIYWHCRLLKKKMAYIGFSAAILSSAVATAGSPTIMAYNAWNSNTVSLAREAKVLNIVAAGVYHIDANGVVAGSINRQIHDIAADNNIKLLATVTNPNNFDPVIAAAVVSQSKAAAISNIVNLAVNEEFAGINLDLEAVPWANRDDYTGFVRDLASALSIHQKTLTISVPTKVWDDTESDWSGAYDYRSLGTLPITLQIMTYDEHIPGRPPGSIAGLPFVKSCMGYALSLIPASKINMGIPAYGYDWTCNESSCVSAASAVQRKWNEMAALITQTGATPQWDISSSSPYIKYTDANNSTHIVWYDNAKSIHTKARLAASLGLGGISVFALGLEDTTYWPGLLAGVKQEAILAASANYPLLN